VTLEQVRRFALSLPEAQEAPHFDCASFRVGGRIFATAPAGGGMLHVFVGEEVRAQAVALHAQHCEALPWGTKVVGLRVRLAGAPCAMVEHLLREAWTVKAPKRLHPLRR
jgi:hypothetical protein